MLTKKDAVFVKVISIVLVGTFILSLAVAVVSFVVIGDVPPDVLQTRQEVEAQQVNDSEHSNSSHEFVIKTYQDSTDYFIARSDKKVLEDAHISSNLKSTLGLTTISVHREQLASACKALGIEINSIIDATTESA